MKTLITILFSIFCFLFSSFSEAAVIYFSPTNAEYNKGDIFISNLRINTENETINSLEALISFNSENLEVLDISRGDSIFSLWLQPPVFSNTEGTISVVGGIPKDGFLGDGKIISIVFRAIGEGYTEVLLQKNTKVLLNDGLGTVLESNKEISKVVIFPQGTELPSNEWQNFKEKDNISPKSFEILLEQNPTVFDGKYFLVFSTIDNQTGIDHYEIKEGNSGWKRGESPYLLKNQSLKEKILVKAIDNAGNERIEEFTAGENKLIQILLLILALIAGLAGMVVMYFKTIKKLGKQK